MHEAQLHDHNSFITLTFNKQSLEKREFPASLDVRDYQLFMKRLRKKTGAKIRYYHCGEYGDLNRRPHYHACLFGYDFPDKQLWSRPNGQDLFTSKLLTQLWPYGFSTIGSVTFESAAYVARYIMKKITGEKAKEHYEHRDQITGEIRTLQPEYITMSRRPGLASGWLEKYLSDVYPSDQIIMQGKILKPPRYYDNQYEIENPDQLADIQKIRRKQGRLYQEHNTPERLADREHIAYRNLTKLPRNHDQQGD